MAPHSARKRSQGRRCFNAQKLGMFSASFASAGEFPGPEKKRVAWLCLVRLRRGGFGLFDSAQTCSSLGGAKSGPVGRSTWKRGPGAVYLVAPSRKKQATAKRREKRARSSGGADANRQTALCVPKQFALHALGNDRLEGSKELPRHRLWRGARHRHRGWAGPTQTGQGRSVEGRPGDGRGPWRGRRPRGGTAKRRPRITGRGGKGGHRSVPTCGADHLHGTPWCV